MKSRPFHSVPLPFPLALRFLFAIIAPSFPKMPQVFADAVYAVYTPLRNQRLFRHYQSWSVRLPCRIGQN